MSREGLTVADVEAADEWLCGRQDEILRASNLAYDVARLYEDDGPDAASVVRWGDALAGALVEQFDGLSGQITAFRAAGRAQAAREALDGAA